MTYCAPAARATLNVMQFTEVHRADQARAEWSGKRLVRAARRSSVHLSECMPCFLSSLPSSPTPLSVPQ